MSCKKLNTSKMNDYKTIDLQEWTCLNKEGDQGSGLIYTNPKEPDVLLKTSRRAEEASRERTVKEFHTAKAVYDLGVPTPKMLEIVKMGDRLGFKSEWLKDKKSFARLAGENPESIDSLAAQMAASAHKLHATQALGSEWIPSMKEVMLQAASSTLMVEGKAKEALERFVEGLEDAPTLLHGKFNFTNIIVENGKTYWIDLSHAAHGLPMFDLGHFYLYCHYFAKEDRVNNIAHMNQEQILVFWNRFAFHYNGPDGIDSFEAQCKRFAGLALVMIGYTAVLTDPERGYLGKLAAYLLQ
ncbi:MAG: phosphotransferase [Bacteroidales bacterium]|nr:phosphotransferase [Bacteroidales bacterium]